MSNFTRGFSDKTLYDPGRRRNLKRWVKIGSKPTSVSLEQEFWDAVREIASHRSQTTSELVSEISAARGNQRNLSAAVSVFVLQHYRANSRMGLH
jgi:predicted DNA-binding ribbon-helix-helix protein